MKKGYRIHYKNEGKPEKTAIIEDYEKAKKSIIFLKWQGATSVRIIPER